MLPNISAPARKLVNQITPRSTIVSCFREKKGSLLRCLRRSYFQSFFWCALTSNMAAGLSHARPRQRAILITSAVVAAVLLVGVAAFSFWPRNSSQSSRTSVPSAKLNSGHSIPLLGLGTYGAKGQTTTDAVTSALALGYRHIDTAQQYDNEEAIGAALGKALKDGTVKREDLFITTKLRTEYHAKEDVESTLVGSLKRLQLDYVDLYLVHWPVTDHPGPELSPSMQETWEGMGGVSDKGLARSIGVSNQSPEKLEAWFKAARIPPAVNQIELHPNWRNDRVLEYAKSKGIHITAYAPLSSPATMDEQEKDVPNLQKDARILQIAKDNNRTAQQVLLQWGLQHGGTQHVSVIPKSVNPDHQKNNLEAVRGTLSAEDYATISNFTYQERYFPGTGWAISDQGPWYTYRDLWNEDPPPNHIP